MNTSQKNAIHKFKKALVQLEEARRQCEFLGCDIEEWSDNHETSLCTCTDSNSTQHLIPYPRTLCVDRDMYTQQDRSRNTSMSDLTETKTPEVPPPPPSPSSNCEQ